MTKTTKCPGISTVVFVIDKGGGEYPKTTTTPSPSYFYVAKIRQTTTEMWRKGRVQIQGRIRKHNQQEKSERSRGGGGGYLRNILIKTMLDINTQGNNSLLSSFGGIFYTSILPF